MHSLISESLLVHSRVRPGIAIAYLASSSSVRACNWGNVRSFRLCVKSTLTVGVDIPTVLSSSYSIVLGGTLWNSPCRMVTASDKVAPGPHPKSRFIVAFASGCTIGRVTIMTGRRRGNPIGSTLHRCYILSGTEVLSDSGKDTSRVSGLSCLA